MLRLAIYFTPSPDSPLGKAGASWFGRDITSTSYGGQLTPQEMDEARFKEITSTPFHYGFHGTIKPPFQLASGTTRLSFYALLEHVVSTIKPIILPELQLSEIDNFLCLTETHPTKELQLLAKKIVTTFDHFRREPTRQELTRRRLANLTPKQELMLMNWGYPYVLDEFRFHLTLTNKIKNQVEKQLIMSHATTVFPKKICQNIPFDGLSVFVEEDGLPMYRTHFYKFAHCSPKQSSENRKF